MESSQRCHRQHKCRFVVNVSVVLYAIFSLCCITTAADRRDDEAYSLMDLLDSAEEDTVSPSLNVSSWADVNNEEDNRHATSGHYENYAGYDDWIVANNQQENLWNREGQRADDSKFSLPQISVYSAAKKKWIMYDILHRQLSGLTANTYSVKTFKMDEHRRPEVKLVLKIFWTMDKTDMAKKIHIIAAQERERHRLPDYPVFVDVTDRLNIEDRLHAIQRTFQEAFDHWSSVLYDRVIFEYIPYNDRLKQSSYFNMVIVVAMRGMVHIDEHTNSTEGFLSKNTLAHASPNLIHFNGETATFYIAPRLVSKHVHIAVDSDRRDKKMKLYELSNEKLAERYRIKTYKELYIRRREMINALVKSRKVKLECLLCVATHEIGHILGLGHANERDSIMYPVTVSQEATITKDDKRAARMVLSELLKRVRAIDREEISKECRKINLYPPHKG